MNENSFKHSDNSNLSAENDKVYSQSKVHKLIDYLVPPQENQEVFRATSNAIVHNSYSDSLKYSDSHQSKKVLSSVSSNSMGNSSSKYSDTHQDKQVFYSVPLKWEVEYSSVKYLDSHKEACSDVGCFIDIENPYYENDYTPSETEDSDFILGYSVDPYSEINRTPPDMEDWEIDSNYDVDPYYQESDSPTEDELACDSNYHIESHYEENGYAFDSNYNVDPHYENDSPPEDRWVYNFKPNYEESASPPEVKWACDSNYNVDPHYEENNSHTVGDGVCDSNYDVDPRYEENNSSSEDEWACNSNYDTGPHYEEDYSPPINKNKQVFPNVTSNWIVEYISIKDLNLHKDTSSSISCFTDLENPYYEGNCTPPETEDSDFILGISVDPYHQEYDTPPEDDWSSYSNYDEENNWRLNSNSNFDPYSAVNECSAAKIGHSLMLRFYEKLIDHLMEIFSIAYFEVCASLEHLIRNHGGVVNGQLPSEIDYCNKSYCLGYLHRYAACHSVMISDSISTILKSSSYNVLKTKLSREQLNVMFLGGGPGNDFVGFLIALYSNRHCQLDLDVTVVDKMSGWREVFYETVQKLKFSEFDQFRNLFNDFYIATSFVPADLKNCEEWSTAMQNKLKRADLIFIVKVLSHIPNKDKLSVLQNIILYTKPGTLLIYVDHPYPKKAFESVSSSLRPVYKSSKKGCNVKATKLKFGYRNIRRCNAEMRVFERQ